MRYQSLLIEAIFESHNTSNKPAISVYQNNYIETGIRALSITYKTVFGILDKHDFRKLASQYILSHPKTCFDWADYGQSFSDYMFDIEALTSMPFLPELAELDWRLTHIERSSNKVFNGESFNLLKTHNPDSLCFLPAPGLQLMEALFPLTPLYRLVHNNEVDVLSENELTHAQSPKHLQVDEVNKLVVNAIKSPVYSSIILWREQYKGLFEDCDEISTKAFKSMLQKNSVSDVLSHFGDDPICITNWLQKQIQSRKIYALEVKT
jgi:hypothetical protein